MIALEVVNRVKQTPQFFKVSSRILSEEIDHQALEFVIEGRAVAVAMHPQVLVD